ncbi:ARL14 effector protein isoform X3 [Paramormyrops kingsleyae]|uniref:ARL14 effector protein isoform X3 n=1 Tax=Paramormyrops kingsleyae TaxID=1676925 RepID=UPI003B96D619
MAGKSASKRRSITLDFKRKIVLLIETKIKTQADIVRDYALSKSTVSDIWSNREKYKTSSQFADGSKKMRKSTYDDVEDALFLWLKQARSLGAPVSGPILKEKAVRLAVELGHNDFKCSDGWLDRFKKRRAVIFRVLSGESVSVPQELATDWLQTKLPWLLDQYDERNIFNADETGLFFKLLPDRTMMFKGDSCHGGKRSKERLTLLFAANMDGSEKLPLLAIGKSAKPRCFKGAKSLPVVYKSNCKAWMTASLFSEWLTDLDRKFVKEERRVLMIVDHCSAHDPAVAEQLKAIKLEFLPPNCTSLLQPCDMGIIQNFKVLYRKRLLQKLIMASENGDMDNFAIDILQCLRWARSVWENEITATTINNCFRKAGIVKNIVSDISAETGEDRSETSPCTILSARDCGNIFERLMELHFLDQTMSAEEFLVVDEHVQTAAVFTDQEIATEVKAKSAGVDGAQTGDESSDEEAPAELPPSTREASMALTLLQRYIEHNANDAVEADVLMNCVGKLDAYITKTSERNAAQKKMTDYFSSQFPISKPQLAAQWVQSLGRKSFVPTANSCLCSEHFQPDCFRDYNGRQFLREDAVPTIFAGCNTTKIELRKSRGGVVAKDPLTEKDKEKDHEKANLRTRDKKQKLKETNSANMGKTAKALKSLEFTNPGRQTDFAAENNRRDKRRVNKYTSSDKGQRC